MGGHLADAESTEVSAVLGELVNEALLILGSKVVGFHSLHLLNLIINNTNPFLPSIAFTLIQELIS